MLQYALSISKDLSRGVMKKPNTKFIDDIVTKIVNNIPEGLKTVTNEFENNCKTILRASFEKLDLVTRDEFDIQKEVLAKTRMKVEELEKIVDRLTVENDQSKQ